MGKASLIYRDMKYLTEQHTRNVFTYNVGMITLNSGPSLLF